jgi:hypothetical protein
MNHQDIIEELSEHVDPNYRAKVLRDYPASARPVLGVPLNYLSSMARSLACRKDWRDVVAHVLSDDSYEEVLLQALTVGNAPVEAEEAFEHTRQYIPKIDSRSLCDASCLAFHAASTAPEKTLQFLKPYLTADDDFGQRFAIVTLLDFFTTSDYIHQTLKIYTHLKPNNANAVDALQWGFMVCFQSYPYKTTTALQQSGLPADDVNAIIDRIVASPRTNLLFRQLAMELRR